MTSEEKKMPKGSGNANEALYPLNDVGRANAILGSEETEDLFCCTCCQPLSIRQNHLDTYKHKIYLERFKSFFEDRGDKIFCKTCSSEIEWKAVQKHASMHKIPPWCESKKPDSQVLFHNSTIRFGKCFYYCFLCESLLDYWDTAASHFTSVIHRISKKKSGPVKSVQTKYRQAVTHGIVPGKDTMNECKMCNLTGLKAEDIKKHSETALHNDNTKKFAAEVIRKQQEKQKSVDVQSNSLESEELKSERLKTGSSKENDEPKQIQSELIDEEEDSRDVAFSNIFTVTGKKRTLFCCVCSENFQNVEKHLKVYKHKIYLKRCRTSFEDRGEKVYCKTCESEIEWEEIKCHAVSHKISPWCQSEKPKSKVFFHNHAAGSGLGFYFCFFCDKYIDYWDTAITHFMEADHQKRKEEFGPTESVETDYTLAITQGIVPGKDMTNDCKMCNVTGLKSEDIKKHSKTAQHKENTDKFTTDMTRMYTRSENRANCECNSVDIKESTSKKVLEADLLANESKHENIMVSYSRDMICNFRLHESSKEVEKNEDSRESGNVCTTITEKDEATFAVKQKKRRNYVDSDGNSSESEESTTELLKVELRKKDSNSKNIKEPENRNMVDNISSHGNSNTISGKTASSTESGNVYKTSHQLTEKHVHEKPYDEAFANRIIPINEKNRLFCCVCDKKLFKTKLEKHTSKYVHEIHLDRSKWAFDDRGKNVFCKICNCEIKKTEIANHGKMHAISPWSELTKPSSETFYRNHTIHFSRGYYYCFLCDKLLDWWDSARSHFMEANHQKRKEKFGPTADLKDTDYMYAAVNGIVPGLDMTYECKMCDKTGLENVDINQHLKTERHKLNKEKTVANMFNKLQGMRKMTPKETELPNASGNANEIFHLPKNAGKSAFTGSEQTKDTYCFTCCQSLSINANHLDSYKHKVYSRKFKSFFEDRGEKIFCKTCTSEIEWKAMKDHAIMHKFSPWIEQCPSAQTFFENHTAKFSPGYCYCFLCDRFLDYLDSVASHFMEADHRKRKLRFGPIIRLKKYKFAIASGFTPGKNATLDCKLCHTTLPSVDIKTHFQAKNHRYNYEKFTKAIIEKHEKGQKFAGSVSDSSNIAASSSKPLKLVSLVKDEKPKKIQVPYNRNMICNFTLRENPDKGIPEAKESLENVEKTDETEYPKLPVAEKPPESAEVVLETINQNTDWPITYIVSSKSELCEAAIVGNDMQRKRKIAKQNTEEPDYYCLICYSEIPGCAAVKDHLNGKRHETARQKYACDNILLIAGEDYWCSACERPVSGFNDVYRHIKSNPHLSSSVRMQSNNHKSQNNVDCVQTLMEAEEGLSCLFIVKQNAKKSFCQICDETQHPVATKNINDHIVSQRHRISLKRYGCDKIVAKGNDNYYCKCCSYNLPSIENVYLHIKDKKHMSSLIKVCDNEGQRGRRRIESHKLLEEFNKPSQNLLSGYISQQINKSLPSEAYDTLQYSMMNNFDVDRSTFLNRFQSPEQKRCGNPSADEYTGDFGIICGNNFTEVKRKAEEPHGRRIKMSALEFEAQAKKFSCNVCGAKAEDTMQLHVHMASHYAEEFLKLKFQKVNRRDKSNHQAQLMNQDSEQSLLVQPEVAPEAKIPNGVAMNGLSNPDVESSNREVAEVWSENDKTELVAKSGVTIQGNEGLTKNKRSRKIANMGKVSKLLNFTEDYIYDLEDKLEEVEFGMMLGLVVDSSRMYCLICRKLVDYTLDDYYEHLENIDHCQYLEAMVTDDALFQKSEDELSDLALAKEYMEEISRDKVRCVICDEDVENNARSLQAHIYHEIHERKCEETRAIARKCFERVKPKMYCDWYEVQKYWCVVCQSDTESEVKFIKHLNGKQHKDNMKDPENRERRLIFDFCASCALLWYGYRYTHSYHNDIDSHKWLQRDGHYVFTELSKHANSLLASPEDFVDDRIKFLDEVFEDEVKREKLLIGDLEKAAKRRFPRAKAHVFGSRISGLGSPDSDIDVFLDCLNLYDGSDFTNDELLFFINGVHQCLCKDPQLWDVDELLTDCRIPIIRATHRATELSCDISFENGLSVENTKLIKAFNQVFPLCRKITLFLKQWLLYCGLSGSRGITSYALYWFVIFYLQQDSILPSVENLIAMRKRSHIIAGWEVGVTHDFTYSGQINNYTIKKLLRRFFAFYANFDFRYNVVCPLLGEIVSKREFVDPRSLPRGMERYIAYMRGPGKPEPFRIDSPMCIQDPFDLQHNLTKAVNKVYLNRFRKCCVKSFETLSSS